MKKETKAMSKRAEEVQASAILPESIISYAKERAVLSGLIYREGVKYGYEQAEKDLALTWEDIAIIDSIILDTNNEIAVDYSKEISRQKFYEEVLARLNEQRKK